MAVWYTENGFVFDGMPVPSGAVPITDQEYQYLLLAAEQGRSIQPDASGRPVAV